MSGSTLSANPAATESKRHIIDVAADTSSIQHCHYFKPQSPARGIQFHYRMATGNTASKQ
jgi:hypothetical protein